MVMDTLPRSLAQSFAAMGQFPDIAFCAAYERAAKPEPLRSFLVVFGVAGARVGASGAVTDLTMTLHAPKDAGSTAILSHLAGLLSALTGLVTPDGDVTVGPVRYDRTQDTLHIECVFAVSETFGA